MCVKLPLENLNPGSYPPPPTSTYTCEVTTRVYGNFIYIYIYIYNMQFCNFKSQKIFFLNESNTNTNTLPRILNPRHNETRIFY